MEVGTRNGMGLLGQDPFIHRPERGATEAFGFLIIRGAGSEALTALGYYPERSYAL